MSEDEQKLETSAFRGIQFSFLLDRFLQTLDALGELLSAVTPIAEELDSPSKRMKDVGAAISEVEPEDRGGFRALAKRHFGSRRKAPSSLESKANELTETNGEPQKEKLEEHQKPAGEEDGSGTSIDFSDFLDDLLDTFGHRRWAVRLASALHKSFIRPHSTPILHRSIIISGVSAFEVLVGEIVAEFYRLTPQALMASGADKEKEFSIADLQELGSVEEAIRLGVTRRIDDLMWQSFDDWADWFNRRLKLDLADLSLDWEAIREVFERRHLMIHNDSRVNRRYQLRVSFEDDPPPIGFELALTEGYVRQAIDGLTTLGALLAVSVWARVVKEESEHAATELSQVVYELMLLGRWRTVKRLCEVGKTLDCRDETRLVFQVNEWLSWKRLNSLDEVIEQVQGWDTSALSPRFRLAKAALMDDSDRTLRYLADALEAKEIALEEAYQWPILEEARSLPKYVEIVGGKGTPHPMGASADKPEGKYVYVAASGKSFHRKTCTQLRGRPSQRVLRTAASEKLRPCKRCSP